MFLFVPQEPTSSFIGRGFLDTLSSLESSVDKQRPGIEGNIDFMQELMKTRAGCKLLSTIGYQRFPTGHQDLLLSHQEQEKLKKTSQSAVMVSSSTLR